MTPAAAESRTACCRTALAALATLRHCEAFVAGLSDEQYATGEARAGASIGQHVRHALDHFAAALAGSEGRTIDYDHRRRDTPVEKSRRAGLDAIRELAGRIEAVARRPEEKTVAVRVMLSAAGEEAELASTLARELAFASHHAIHHHAMMLLIAQELGAPAPAGFGKAPATLHHERCSG